jgi:hypothetical protein
MDVKVERLKLCVTHHHAAWPACNVRDLLARRGRSGEVRGRGKWRLKVSGKYHLLGVRPGNKPIPLAKSAPEGTRTPNLLIRSQVLYPLSYGRICSIVGG